MICVRAGLLDAFLSRSKVDDLFMEINILGITILQISTPNKCENLFLEIHPKKVSLLKFLGEAADRILSPNEVKDLYLEINF